MRSVDERRCTLQAMRLTVLITLFGVAGCGGGLEAPTPTTASSRAALLSGDYALTVTLDDRCTQPSTRTWTYHATLLDAGGYLAVRVTGDGYSEPTVVGQVYTYPDFTARIIWNTDDPESSYPDPRVYGPRLLLYGASESKVVSGGMSGMILGTASTTLDFNGRCDGSHRFIFVSTGNTRN